MDEFNSLINELDIKIDSSSVLNQPDVIRLYKNEQCIKVGNYESCLDYLRKLKAESDQNPSKTNQS